MTADFNWRKVSIIHSPLTFKIGYGYKLGALGLLPFPLVLMNRLCLLVVCFLFIPFFLSITGGSIFPDYFDVVAAVVVPCGVGIIFSLYIKIVLIFFPYFGFLGILCSDGK